MNIGNLNRSCFSTAITLKNAVENINMPDDMKARIIDNCQNAHNPVNTSDNQRKRYHLVLTGLCTCAVMLLIAFFVIKFTGNTITHTDDNNILNINVIDSVSQAAADIGIYAEDFVPMTYEEIIEYYGKEISPTVPADLKYLSNNYYGIYKRDSGTGEVYYDNTLYEYISDDKSRDLRMEIAKNKLPLTCTIVESFNPKISIINGTELIIHSLTNSEGTHYYTRFICNDIGYDIEISNFTVEEVYELLNSLTK